MRLMELTNLSEIYKFNEAFFTEFFKDFKGDSKNLCYNLNIKYGLKLQKADILPFDISVRFALSTSFDGAALRTSNVDGKPVEGEIYVNIKNMTADEIADNISDIRTYLVSALTHEIGHAHQFTKKLPDGSDTEKYNSDENLKYLASKIEIEMQSASAAIELANIAKDNSMTLRQFIKLFNTRKDDALDVLAKNKYKSIPLCNYLVGLSVIDHKDVQKIYRAFWKRLYQYGDQLDILDGIDVNPESSDFEKWFDGSVVVDDKGEPLVVYHYGSFNENSDIPRTGMHWGTRRAAIDRGYADDRDKFYSTVTAYKRQGEWYWTEPHYDLNSYEMGEFGFDSRQDAIDAGIAFLVDMFSNMSDEQSDRARDEYISRKITAAWICLKNPMETHDAGVDDFWNELIAEAKAKGHDGLKYVNDVEDAGSTSWVVFEPTQVKSLKNKGTFDPKNPSIVRMKKV